MAEASVSIAGIRLARAARWNALLFDAPRTVLSSAPVDGGEVIAERVVNLCVSGPECLAQCEDPAAAFDTLANGQGWTGTSVGLMTGVSADRVGIARERSVGAEWLVLASVGFSNAHRAGGPAAAHAGPGTINVIAAATHGLTAAARAEALLLIGESKATVLADHGIVAAATGAIATGTGTDAAAVVAGPGADTPYTGYHTESGQCLARAVIAAMERSMAAGRSQAAAAHDVPGVD